MWESWRVRGVQESNLPSVLCPSEDLIVQLARRSSLGSGSDCWSLDLGVMMPVSKLTFPHPGNSHACTRLPFLALLMRPVGVHDGAFSREIDEVLIVEELWRREDESGGIPSAGE